MYQQHQLSVTQVAALKCFITDVQCEVIDQLLQLLVATVTCRNIRFHAFCGCAGTKIYGGTNEIMKEIVARELLGK
ncbi:acyl-CoA dehydrogenase family protein [Acinetobacter baumannii]